MPRSSERPRRTRITLDPEGPLLVEGPVEVALPDGTVASSDRFTVAVCACRRSRTYPWCDTSHRRRARRGTAEDGRGETGGRDETEGPES